MEKGDIRNLLINTGRAIIQENGVEALTARKLSEVSGCSVGAIYNHFSNMENYLVTQNYITLDFLISRLNSIKFGSDSFVNLNIFIEEFTNFVIKNKNLWYLLYSFHLRNNNRDFSFYYLRKIVTIILQLNKLVYNLLPKMEKPERILSIKVLWLALFSLSSLLTRDIIDSFSKINKKTICQIMANTFVAGLTVLEKKNGSN